ncbi:MAG: P-II family nitrogen regulator [Saprospiraceae bacterium]|nr:P-II family nitrogen regulator [Saprospiraceae bacterium]
MKKIEAIIRLAKFEEIRAELASIGIPFFTLQEVKGYGLQKGNSITYRGSSYDSDYIPRLQLEIFTEDEKVEEVISTILHAGGTGEIGDGKIVVIDIEQIVRIRTGEVGASAI